MPDCPQVCASVSFFILHGAEEGAVELAEGPPAEPEGGEAQQGGGQLEGESQPQAVAGVPSPPPPGEPGQAEATAQGATDTRVGFSLPFHVFLGWVTRGWRGWRGVGQP